MVLSEFTRAFTLSGFVVVLCAFPFRIFLKGGLNAQTTFLDYKGCSADEGAIIVQAHRDALILANAALEKDREPSKVTPNVFLNFDTVAAIDYFGPLEQNAQWRQRIFDTFLRATQTYRGWGWSDWWHSRYISVSCGHREGYCEDAIAFTTVENDPYPSITYCARFFDEVFAYSTVMRQLKRSNYVIHKNVENMVSQASIALHEWLHVGGSPAEICQGGCKCVYFLFEQGKSTQGGLYFSSNRGKNQIPLQNAIRDPLFLSNNVLLYMIRTGGFTGQDQVQSIGRIPTKSYKAGRSKLLATRDPKWASFNNDNYVYFAMAKHMLNVFGRYPQYPTAWDPTKTPKENQELEKRQPGYTGPWEIEGLNLSEPDNYFTERAHIISKSPYPLSKYPLWYQSIIKGTDQGHRLSHSSNHISRHFSRPNINDIICDTNERSPYILDCVNAFERLYKDPANAAQKGKEGDCSWEGSFKSCAVAVSYTGNWTGCNANLRDIREHASAIFEACQDGGRGRVGGNVDIKKSHCPATILITQT